MNENNIINNNGDCCLKEFEDRLKCTTYTSGICDNCKNKDFYFRPMHPCTCAIHPELFRHLWHLVKAMALEQMRFEKEINEKVGSEFLQLFGDNENKGISQKKITKAIEKIWSKISDITGEVYQGINMIVTPNYYSGNEGCEVNIYASNYNETDTFDHIAFYFNDELIAQADDVSTFEYTTEINGSVEVLCKATIAGVEYTQRRTITHRSSFFLGAGNNYSDVMTQQYELAINGDIKGSYDVLVNNNDHIFIILDESLRSLFVRADINGMEIPFDESTVTVNDRVYKVFTSTNSYSAGTYNIDINS